MSAQRLNPLDAAWLEIGQRPSVLGSGGMRSKVVAAEMATAAGIPTTGSSGSTNILMLGAVAIVSGAGLLVVGLVGWAFLVAEPAMAPTFLPSRYSGRTSLMTASRRDTKRAGAR